MQNQFLPFQQAIIPKIVFAIYKFLEGKYTFLKKIANGKASLALAAKSEYWNKCAIEFSAIRTISNLPLPITMISPIKLA